MALILFHSPRGGRGLAVCTAAISRTDLYAT